MKTTSLLTIRPISAKALQEDFAEGYGVDLVTLNGGKAQAQMTGNPNTDKHITYQVKFNNFLIDFQNDFDVMFQWLADREFYIVLANN